MSKFYKDGFYDTEINAAIPADAVAITKEYWQELLEGQSAGKKIQPDETGYPVLVEIPATPAQIQAAYDRAMEDYLASVRMARGYTVREPSDYTGSSVPRWASDAADWITFRDAVMLYGLNILNSALVGGNLPTVEDFVAGMPVITWTYVETE